MKRTFENYLIMVGIRSLEYTYTDEQIMDNTEYFKKCYNDHLSAYKALLFLGDHLHEYEVKDGQKLSTQRIECHINPEKLVNDTEQSNNDYNKQFVVGSKERIKNAEKKLKETREYLNGNLDGDDYENYKFLKKHISDIFWSGFWVK